jgi:hypothetical protein
MIMPAPALDDRTFDDLVREGLALLPTYAPEWTDHNVSDPGITLVELLAYFSDILLYRIGRITPAARLQFLRLLAGRPDIDFAGPDPLATSGTGDELQRAIDSAVRELAHMDCAVTPRDFERFALAAAKRAMPEQHVRARCLPNTDLSGEASRSGGDLRNHVTLVLAPADDTPPDTAARLREAVRADLAGRCLLTVHLHVVPPVVLEVGLGFDLALRPGASLHAALADIRDALQRRFIGTHADDAPNPHGFGQPLHLSAVAAAIDHAPGVDYVENVSVLALGTRAHADDADLGVQLGTTSTVGIDTRLGGPPGFDRLLRDSDGALASVVLQPWEVLHLLVLNAHVHVIGHAADYPAEGGDHA